jgi:hypothetical protein
MGQIQQTSLIIYLPINNILINILIMTDIKEIEKKFKLENDIFMEGMVKGVTIGREAKKEEIAIRMLHDKEPIDKIMQFTGITWKELKETLDFREMEEEEEEEEEDEEEEEEEE